MTNSLKKIGLGLAMVAISFAMLSPAKATNNSAYLSAGFNFRALSQFTLINNAELTQVSATTAPTQLTVKLKRPRTRIVTVAVSNETIITNNLFGKSSLSELTVGDNLQLFGRYDDGGVLHVLSIKDNSIQLTSGPLTGSITALDPVAMTFTLSHRSGFSARRLPLTVRLNDKTKIVSTDGKVLTFADLQLQQQVSVSGVLNTSAHTLIATEVKAKVVAPQPLPFSLQGTLTAISGTDLPAQLTVKVTNILPPLQTGARARATESIDMVTFQVDAKTKLVTKSGETVTLKDFVVGDSLVVQGNMDSAGAITATIVRNDSAQNAITAKGSISSIDATAQTFALLKADGSKLNVAISNATILSVPGISKPTFADLKAGYMIEVQGTFNTRTNWLAASSVTVTEIPQPLPFSLKGKLTAISSTDFPARLTVTVTEVLPPLEMKARSMMNAEPINVVTFQVDANTKFVNKSGTAIMLKDLVLGDIVAVQGNTDNAGNITATIVRDDSIDVIATPLSGTIESIDAGAYTFAFTDASDQWYTAHVLSSTLISVPGVSNATFANLYVGNGVTVTGILNSNTSVIQPTGVTVTATTTVNTSTR
jgi:hypothetical protein